MNDADIAEALEHVGDIQVVVTTRQWVELKSDLARVTAELEKVTAANLAMADDLAGQRNVSNEALYALATAQAECARLLQIAHRVTAERDRLAEEYAKAAAAYGGIVHTLDRSGRQREQAEADLARVTAERDAARSALVEARSYLTLWRHRYFKMGTGGVDYQLEHDLDEVIRQVEAALRDAPPAAEPTGDDE